MSDSRFSSTVGIFRNFIAMFSLAFGALNPEYIYATDRTVAAKAECVNGFDAKLIG
jgi:hypothetical protein